MARTQAPDYDQRREAIVDVAARLFAKAGFAETSVAELAAACAMSKSLMYHYYASKEEILYAVMASHIDRLDEEVGAVMAMAASPETMLAALIRGFMDNYVGAAERQKVLLNELDSLPADNRASIVRKQRRIVEAVQRLLMALYPELAADPVRARVRTMLVFGMINWTHTWFDPTGALHSDDIADMVLAMTLPPAATDAQPS